MTPLFLAPFLMAMSPAGFSSAVTQPTFGKPVNISRDAALAQDPNVQSLGNHVYVVWTERSAGIKFRFSLDGGLTWNPPLTKPAERISNLGGTAQYPLMSANGTNVYIVWAQSIGATGLQIMEATSLNSGASFNLPVQLTSGSPAGGYIGPAIASWGNNVYVAYDNSNNGQHDFVTCSASAGALGSWTPPLQYAVYHEAQIAAWGGRYVYAIGDRGNSLVVSSDNCGTFKNINLVPAIVSEPWIGGYGANFYGVWETKGNNSRITVTTTGNNGTSWSTPINLTISGVWAPQVSAFGSFAWIATQQHPGSAASQIFEFTTTNTGTSWTGPTSLSGPPAAGSDTSFAFNIATSDGTNVFVAWSQQIAAGHWVLRVSYSPDGGTTWTPPPGINVSNNPRGDAGNNSDVANAEISAFGTHCYAVWQFINGGTNQIYFASS